MCPLCLPCQIVIQQCTRRYSCGGCGHCCLCHNRPQTWSQTPPPGGGGISLFGTPTQNPHCRYIPMWLAHPFQVPVLGLLNHYLRQGTYVSVGTVSPVSVVNPVEIFDSARNTRSRYGPRQIFCSAIPRHQDFTIRGGLIIIGWGVPETTYLATKEARRIEREYTDITRRYTGLTSKSCRIQGGGCAGEKVDDDKGNYFDRDNADWSVLQWITVMHYCMAWSVYYLIRGKVEVGEGGGSLEWDIGGLKHYDRRCYVPLVLLSCNKIIKICRV